MRRTPNRCEQILELIDACLREVAPAVPGSALASTNNHFDTRKRGPR